MTMNVPSRPATVARAAAAGLLVLLLLACGADSPDKLMASAKDYLAKGDRAAAVIQLKNLLTKAPDNGEARLLLGQALFDGGDYVAAEKELGRALELKQPQEKVLPAYALALLRQGKHQAVVAEVPKYRLFDPQAVATTQTALGDAYAQLGDVARARGAYAAAVTAVPDYGRAQLGEAMLIATEGQLDEALKLTNGVIAAEPRLAEAHRFHADILLAKGDREGAKKAFEEAIAVDSRYLPARLALIGLLIDGRDFDGAAKLIESTRQVAPGDRRVAYMEASLAFRRGEPERARQQVQQVLKQLPDHVPSLVLAGSIDLAERQFVAAEANLRKAVARAPSHVAARQLLVRTYLGMGQPAKARDALQPLLAGGQPFSPDLQMLAGETYLANGDLERATAFYQAAAKRKDGDGQRAAAHIRLGQVALVSGRDNQGFKELEIAADLDPGAYEADLALIAGHVSRKEFDKAMEGAKALEKKQPLNPLTFQVYGMINMASRDFDAARKSFDRALELQPNYLPAAFRLAQLDAAQMRPEDARKRYEAMIARDPNNEQIYIALAELLQGTGGSPNDIAANLQRAVQANPQSPAARAALIEFQLRSGNAKAALAVAREALAAMPSDPRVLDAAGVAQEAAGEINQAVGTYNKLASLQPQAPAPLYRLAALYLRQKDTDKAIESLRRAQKIAPRERDVVPQLVQVYVAAGRYDEAVKEARQLQKREPRFAGAFALEGDIYSAQKKFADAERLYREALKLEPKSGLFAVKLHGALSGAGKTAEAEGWAKKWTAENPKDPTMRTYLGDRELAARNLKAAAAHYQVAVGIEPNNARALNQLAWIGGELGDPKAIGYAERAAQIEPHSFAILDTYGVLLLKKGEADRAVLLLERAHKLAPARGDVRLNYAKALIKAGRKDDARRELQALQGVKENFPGKDQVAGLLQGL